MVIRGSAAGRSLSGFGSIFTATGGAAGGCGCCSAACCCGCCIIIIFYVLKFAEDQYVAREIPELLRAVRTKFSGRVFALLIFIMMKTIRAGKYIGKVLL